MCDFLVREIVADRCADEEIELVSLIPDWLKLGGERVFDAVMDPLCVSCFPVREADSLLGSVA